MSYTAQILSRGKNVLSPRVIRTDKNAIETADQLDPLQEAYNLLLLEAGEEPKREGLLKTPERAAKAWKFLTSGYGENPIEILKSAVFEEEYHEMVMVRDIEFFSLCEHHLLPFFGKVHVAYYAAGKIVGLSKLPRVVDAVARRLQVQERMTTQIADYIESTLNPRGVAVMVEAVHMCMMMRGVEKQNSATTTTSMRGVFDTDWRSRDLFLNSLNKSRS
jgi:GTP cyclohydrolase I